MRRILRAIGMLIVGIVVLTGASPVGAHEGEEKRPPDAATAVRQALAFLEATPPNLSEAGERLEWAGEAKEQAGVNGEAVKQAADALRAKDAARARALLREALAAPAGTPAAQGQRDIAGSASDRRAETAAHHQPGAPLDALTVGFGGSSGDYVSLALAVVLAVAGSLILRRA